MLRVAILDDHPAVLAGLRRLIDAEHDMTVVAAAATPAELAEQIDGIRVDVLVLDYDLAAADGLAYCRRVKSRPRPPRIVIYTADATPALTLAARAAQADGVIGKAEPIPVLLSSIRRVAQGEAVMPPLRHEAYEALIARIDDEDLPILAMLLDGESLDAIAATLRIDRTEVGWRAQRIVGRLRRRIRMRSDEPAAETATVAAAGSRSPW
jgi:two-component system, NarL family, response regulator DevR